MPKMSVLSNVFLGDPISKGFLIDRAAMAKRFQEISETFGLRMPANTPAGKLSVANRQKVEILKAIQAGRKILIMDEPTAALDPQIGRLLQSNSSASRGGVIHHFYFTRFK